MWGMTEEQFWHGSLNTYFAYMAKYSKERELKQRESDYIAWLHGIYSNDAFVNVISNAFGNKKKAKLLYPKEPRLQEADPVKEEEPPKVNYSKLLAQHNKEMKELFGGE